MSQKLILIRGLPGAGKSTLAEKLLPIHDAVHYEADQFHEATGEYEYNKDLLQFAHAWCIGNVAYQMKLGQSVIVSNTFTQAWEIEPYFQLAQLFGCELEIIHVKTMYGSVHDVPRDVINRMKNRFVPNKRLPFKYKLIKMTEYPGNQCRTS